MNFRAWLWQLSALALLGLSQTKRQFNIGINNVTCDVIVPAMVKELNCFFNKERSEPTLSARFSLNKPIKQMGLLVDFSIMKKDNTRIGVVHTKIDGCKQLRTASQNDFYGRIFSAVRRISNLPSKCPIPADHLYEIHNYTITLEKMPVVLSALTYHCRFKILSMNEAIAEIGIETAVKN